MEHFISEFSRSITYNSPKSHNVPPQHFKQKPCTSLRKSPKKTIRCAAAVHRLVTLDAEARAPRQITVRWVVSMVAHVASCEMWPRIVSLCGRYSCPANETHAVSFHIGKNETFYLLFVLKMLGFISFSAIFIGVNHLAFDASQTLRFAHNTDPWTI